MIPSPRRRYCRNATAGTLLIAAALGAGCGLQTRDAVNDMDRLLRDYVRAQEMYYVEHNRYAPEADSLTRGVAVPPWMQVHVLRSNAAGHRAFAWTTRAPDRVCVVFAGPLPSTLGEGFPGEPMCGARERFGRFLGDWTPRSGEPDSSTLARVVSILVIVVILSGLLAATYGCGVFLDRVARRRPWVWKAVGWTPAGFVTCFIGLSLGLAPTLQGAGGYGLGWAAIGIGIGAVPNLGLFALPYVMRKPRSADWWAGLGLLAVGAVAFAWFATTVAGDVAGSRRFNPGGTNTSTLILANAALAMSLLNLMGVAQLIRVRRRTKQEPRADQPQTESAGSESASQSRNTTPPRRRVLLLSALAVSVLLLLLNGDDAADESVATDPLRLSLEAYVHLQEAYHADNGRYATEAETRAVPVRVGVTRRIISSSDTSHSAIAFSDSVPHMCAVWVGVPVRQLDHDRGGVPVCDLPPRFEPWLAAVRRGTR